MLVGRSPSGTPSQQAVQRQISLTPARGDEDEPIAPRDSADFSRDSVLSGLLPLGLLRRVTENSLGEQTLHGACKKIIIGGEKHLVPEGNWSNMRKWVAVLVASNAFELFMGLVIVFNVVIMCIETDRRAVCEDQRSKGPDCSANDPDMTIPDTTCMVIYCVELSVRLYAWQQKFCSNGWNIFDALIVFTSLAGTLFGSALGDARFFRAVRIIKLLRITRQLTLFPELYLMISSMASTMRTIFWAVGMLCAVLIVCSFLAVQLLHPVMERLDLDADCSRCPNAFISIEASMITFFQTLIMGDGVGDYFIPLMEADFVAGLLILIFVSVVYLGFSNLILSVIVEKATEARNDDSTYKGMIDHKIKAETRKEITQFWRELEDDDGQNTMSLQELKHLYSTSAKFRNYFARLDMDMPFLEYAFKVMDADGSGDCTLEDFVSSVVQLKSTDPGPVVSFIKYQIMQVNSDIAELKKYIIQDGLSLTSRCEKDRYAYRQALASGLSQVKVDMWWPGERLETVDAPTGKAAKHVPEPSRDSEPKQVRPTGSVDPMEPLCHEAIEQTDPMMDQGNFLDRMASRSESRGLVPENEERLSNGTVDGLPSFFGMVDGASSTVSSSPFLPSTSRASESDDLVEMLRNAYDQPQTAKASSVEQPHTLVTRPASMRETVDFRRSVMSPAVAASVAAAAAGAFPSELRATTSTVADDQLSPVNNVSVSSALATVPSLQGLRLSRR